MQPLMKAARRPLAPEWERYGLDHQERIAKLVVVAVVRADATDAGIYSRPDVRLKGKRQSPVRSDVSSNYNRIV